MKNRTMTLEQAYRYVLRRVDYFVRVRQENLMEIAKKLEKFQYSAWTELDAMELFIERNGQGLVENIAGTIQYRKV